MKRNKFLELIGFRFIVNHESKEIHRVRHLTENCFVKQMVNAGYATAWMVRRLLRHNYNGCRHCYNAEDKG